jgi:hypothetical protein
VEKNKARRQWFMPQEANIRRIDVQSQPGQIVHKTLSQKHPSHKKRLVEWLKV